MECVLAGWCKGSFSRLSPPLYAPTDRDMRVEKSGSAMARQDAVRLDEM